MARVVSTKLSWGLAALTPFETAVLEGRARGLTVNQLAVTVNRSPSTIAHSLTIAKEKLNASSVLEAAVILRAG